jgi:hypothetical protein
MTREKKRVFLYSKKKWKSTSANEGVIKVNAAGISEDRTKGKASIQIYTTFQTM